MKIVPAGSISNYNILVITTNLFLIELVFIYSSGWPVSSVDCGGPSPDSAGPSSSTLSRYSPMILRSLVQALSGTVMAVLKLLRTCDK